MNFIIEDETSVKFGFIATIARYLYLQYFYHFRGLIVIYISVNSSTGITSYNTTPNYLVNLITSLSVIKVSEMLSVTKLVLLLTLTSTTLQNRLKIISTPEPRSDNYACSITCVGSTHFSSDYEEYDNGAGKQYFYKRIDISGCGFLSVPVVMVTLDGQVTRVAVSNVERDGFDVIISSLSTVTWLTEDWDLTIHWSTYGYSCYTKCGL